MRVKAIAMLAPAICCLVLPRIKFSKLSIAFLASRVAFWVHNGLFTAEVFRTRAVFFGAGVCKRSIIISGGFNSSAVCLRFLLGQLTSFTLRGQLR